MPRKKSEDSDVKKDYEDTLNKVLGLQVRWSKLTIDELEQISNKIANILVEKEEPKNEGLGDLLDLLLPEKYQGPGVKLLKRVLSNIK